MGSSEHFDNARIMRDRLNAVSPSLCSAKWLQVTLHLETGRTHSCHHPIAHPIPLAEIAQNPSALHNTEFKKQRRREMLNGERPSECDYCWNVEDLKGDYLSDRHLKSSDPWAASHLEKVAALPWHSSVNPTYLEVSFSSQCQFKCSYCYPEFSSRLKNEILESGSYNLGNGYLYHDLKNQPVTYSEEENPYIEAFWKWWPDLYPQLEELRITGGEPFLSKNTFRVLEWVLAHPRAPLAISINSNLGFADTILEKFLKMAKPLCQEKKIRELSLFTSVDSSGPQAEYLRHGLNYEKWKRNLRTLFRELPGIKVVIMCTFNNLSSTGFRGLMDDVQAIRKEFSVTSEKLFLDINYLRHPSWQSVQNLSENHIQDIHRLGQYMIDQSPGANGAGFSDVEIEKLLRLAAWASSEKNSATIEKSRSQFYHFFREHDRRRGSDFLKTFPQMTDFWNLCRSAADSATV